MTARADIQDAGRIRLVPRPKDEAFGDTPGRARELFDILQDRHVACSPNAAQHLAAFEREDKSPASDSYWGRAYGLAATEIGLGGKMGYASAWANLFASFVQIVAEPILREGTRRGEINLVLTIQARSREGQGAAEFQAIDAWADRALSDPDEMGRGFWIAAGVSLLSAFRKQRPGRGERRRLGLPSLPDLRLAEIVYGLEPQLEEDPIWKKIAPKPSARSNRLRVGIRPREGGVTGVLHTRRIRDLPDALPSAFVMPENLRVVKLIEEGFMIPHRPPHRRPDRDLLSMTMQAGDVAALASATLAKAAWIDAVIRLRILLANLSMVKSELGYAHLRSTGAMTAAMSLATDAPRGRLDALQIKEETRKNAVSLAGIFPDVFDTVVAAKTRETISSVRSWDSRARDQLLVACGKAAAGTKADIDDFARVCLIEAAPAVIKGDETVTVAWRDDRRAMLRRYGFDRQDKIHAARILCPPRVVIGAAFTVCGDEDAEPETLDIKEADTERDSLQHVIGALSGWIIKQNLLAAAHG